MMVETVISMVPFLRNEVLSGERTEAWRPDRRDYQPGPATIRFLDGVEIPVTITDVRYVPVEGKYRVYQDVLAMLGEPDHDEMTVIVWELVT